MLLCSRNLPGVSVRYPVHCTASYTYPLSRKDVLTIWLPDDLPTLTAVAVIRPGYTFPRISFVLRHLDLEI